MMGGLSTAIRTLTILPAPGEPGGKMASSLPWFPLVGGAIGSILLGLMILLEDLASGHWPGGAAAVVVVAGIILTGALHLDGLADWADGFGGGRDREKTLAIMKDSSTGAFGAVALISVLLLKWVALSRLADSGTQLWIIVACVISRTMMVELAVWLPYARTEGGTGATIVEGAKKWHRYLVLLLALAILTAFAGAAGAQALVAGWLVCRGFGYLCLRRVGGVTGDLLGAGSEIVETLILVLAALPGRELPQLSGWVFF
ncbi:MAG: adenosylcobinamide-GDP ribazoletransferase [Nitrospinaceae bacterium]|jgi:adenosylcobinamide-GDP ribazoletransferase|nr:adenosylcobinamide-GDP ribazoletransferase [Nitrospinaceae bacterium]MBT4094112.1 adenosylcobinamide-GDP ribazoletransferase [Nitrospinaceae bacterium]MBT4431631.1 adenosylcobinamide-GDP ribazoletransferase [Nitrospinaceae bacterium]MBT5367477.1 adenosylcobinamide-GDP ribazoletransferase [Nitrospinaceae bacterium]MBT5949294.1 adenosylcobinamide-GDP ribazoletransferase [Nitrospinaceae bacterium]